MEREIDATDACQDESSTSNSSSVDLYATETKKGVAPFLLRLHKMLSTEDDQIICWRPDGTAFEIRDKKLMVDKILPKYCNNKNFASFQRQLNYFGFRKWSKFQSKVCTYSRAHFVRDGYDELKMIKRQSKRMKLDSVGSSLPSEYGSALMGDNGQCFYQRLDWSPEEHQLFLDSYEKYAGESRNDRWKLMEQHIGTRKIEDIQRYALRCFGTTVPPLMKQEDDTGRVMKENSNLQSPTCVSAVQIAVADKEIVKTQIEDTLLQKPKKKVRKQIVNKPAKLLNDHTNRNISQKPANPMDKCFVGEPEKHIHSIYNSSFGCGLPTPDNIPALRYDSVKSMPKDNANYRLPSIPHHHLPPVCSLPSQLSPQNNSFPRSGTIFMPPYIFQSIRVRDHMFKANPEAVKGDGEKQRDESYDRSPKNSSSSLYSYSVPSFLRSLYDILDNENADIIGWTDSGNAFEIRDIDLLIRELLPKYFKHSKFPSFQRQLNMYGFKKWTKTRASTCTYSHPHFLKGGIGELGKIRRKTHPSYYTSESMEVSTM